MSETLLQSPMPEQIDPFDDSGQAYDAFLEDHGNDIINIHGRMLPLGTAVELAQALSPSPKCNPRTPEGFKKLVDSTVAAGNEVNPKYTQAAEKFAPKKPDAESNSKETKSPEKPAKTEKSEVSEPAKPTTKAETAVKALTSAEIALLKPVLALPLQRMLNAVPSHDKAPSAPKAPKVVEQEHQSKPKMPKSLKTERVIKPRERVLIPIEKADRIQEAVVIPVAAIVAQHEQTPKAKPVVELPTIALQESATIRTQETLPVALKEVPKAPAIISLTETVFQSEPEPPAMLQETQEISLADVSDGYRLFEVPNPSVEAVENSLEGDVPLIDQEAANWSLFEQSELDDIFAGLFPAESGLADSALNPTDSELNPDMFDRFALEPIELGTETLLSTTMEDTAETAIETKSTAELTGETGTETETLPVVTAKIMEFIVVVNPAIAEKVYEFVTDPEMPPEVVVEIEARVEQLTVVANRLHEIVTDGKGESEEAVQIKAFLAEEYEQLLRSVGTEVNETTVQNFILYVCSTHYQLIKEADNNPLEIYDDGTHERKLFDEVSVFTKAQKASALFVQKVENQLGRLAVYSLAA